MAHFAVLNKHEMFRRVARYRKKRGRKKEKMEKQKRKSI